MRIAIPALAFALASPLYASCLVTPLDVTDHSRTIGLPFASPADSGAESSRVRALVFTRGTATRRPSYAELIRAVTPGVVAGEHLVSRLRFYGAAVDSVAAVAAVQASSSCSLAARPARPAKGIVLIVGAFPTVLYEGAAAALAEEDIATVVMSGSESSVRLVLNHLAALQWPVHNVALVGHGTGVPSDTPMLIPHILLKPAEVSCFRLHSRKLPASSG